MEDALQVRYSCKSLWLARIAATTVSLCKIYLSVWVSTLLILGGRQCEGRSNGMSKVQNPTLFLYVMNIGVKKVGLGILPSLNCNMSQDRTVVPGMEGTDYQNNYDEGIYTRKPYTGTVVPGMMDTAQSAERKPQAANPNPSGVPVVGFLYSISRQGVGEYWPVQVGRNDIGRDATNQIVLLEQTVSGYHASLLVQKKRNTGEVVAVIRDESGKNGVIVNGEEVDLRYGCEVKNGDIITIGYNYTFILILINAEAVGLSVAENFMLVAEEKEEEELDFMKTRNNPYDHNWRGTIPADGTNGEEPGGTRFM